MEQKPTCCGKLYYKRNSILRLSAQNLLEPRKTPSDIILVRHSRYDISRWFV